MWSEFIKPKYGDQIRVNRGLYFHHGIYESDDRIYQFAAPEGSEINEQNAKIIATNLETFLKGGILEVRQYSADELQRKRSPEDIILYAKRRLGSNEGGYNLISNNCEHFSNRCAFGVNESDQVNNIAAALAALFGGR